MGIENVVFIKIGRLVRPRHVIYPDQVRRWKYASECGSFDAGILTWAKLRVAEKSGPHGDTWVKLEILGISPPCLLKVSAYELVQNFDHAD